jgi:hypothetical protein
MLAVDPGNTQSAWALIDPHDCKPLDIGKRDNNYVRDALRTLSPCSTVAIEMVASYGMPVGADVFETCVEIGDFRRIVEDTTGRRPHLIYRRDVKLHHCNTPRANDANITQALIDRFAAGQPNRGKGTKKQPGWFHGFAADIWQAYALAVLLADTTRREVAA